MNPPSSTQKSANTPTRNTDIRNSDPQSGLSGGNRIGAGFEKESEEWIETDLAASDVVDTFSAGVIRSLGGLHGVCLSLCRCS